MAEININRESTMPETFFARRLRIQRIQDFFFINTTKLFAIIVLVIFASIIAYLVKGSMPAIKAFGWHFFISATWDPVTEDFGALVPTIGTLVTAFIALLIAVPVSFGIALFLTELAPSWIKQPLRIVVELLAGIPSIIYGMWGLFVFAPAFATYGQPWLNDHLGNVLLIGPLFQGPPIGIGVLTAGIILAIMIIPFIAAVMRDVFEIVPDMLKESAYGLGATTWEVMWHVVMPYARIGVIGGIMLGLGRALGETMAVAFVIGNAHQLSASLLMPGNSIASVLANEFTEAVGPLYNAALVQLGLILFMITCIVLLLSKLLLRRLSKQEGN